MLSTVVIINILYARAINIDKVEACKDIYYHGKEKYFNAFFMSTNYCFVMSNAYNTVMLVKCFETTVYMYKTEVRCARNGLLRFLLTKRVCSAYRVNIRPNRQW